MSLEDYNRKRNFEKSPEPKGKVHKAGKGLLRFVIQLHEASRLHYDFRLEVEGVLKSWAVPKGPTLDPSQQHLAVQVEDHPLEYGDFEGIIPKGNYGAGTVMIWDQGTYVERTSQEREDSQKAILKGLENRHITFILNGKKLQGEFALIGLKGKEAHSWLLVKKRDEFATRKPIPHEKLSVKTGRTLQEISAQAEIKGEVWLVKAPHKPNPLPPLGGVIAIPKPRKVSAIQKIPRRNKPMIPTAWPEPFEQKGWIFEMDHGGLRAISEIENSSVRLYSKQFLSFSEKFPKIIESLWRTLEQVKLTAVLDGEIYDGIYWVWDLIHLNGMNLHSTPLSERKELLKKLTIFSDLVRFSEHQPHCAPLFKKAQQEGYSGILARDAFSPYSAGPSKQWLKIATQKKEVDQGPRFTHLDKILWPKDKITKGDLVDYYRTITPVILPYLKDRPQSMHRHPDGIQVPGFFHKNLIEHHPRWVKTESLYSDSSRKSINYLLCQNESTLLYMVNLGCIEINPWLSRVGSLDRPDFIVIDLDPDDSNSFSEVIEVALEIHRILKLIKAPHFCKTSGATGMHLFIPTQGRYDYATARQFASAVCEVIHQHFPKNTSLNRNPGKRRGRIYLDCYQNAEGQTIAAPYSVRPRPGASVSTPLFWKEVTLKLEPLDFNMHTVPKRLEKKGDPWVELLSSPPFDLVACLSSLSRNFPIDR